MKLRATLCFVLVMLVGVMPGHAGLTIGLTRSLRICLNQLITVTPPSMTRQRLDRHEQSARCLKFTQLQRCRES